MFPGGIHSPPALIFIVVSFSPHQNMSVKAHIVVQPDPTQSCCCACKCAQACIVLELKRPVENFKFLDKNDNM